MAKDVSIAREAPQPGSVRAGQLAFRVPSAPSQVITRFGRRLTRRFPPCELASFAAIGAICTVLFALVYHVARGWLPPLAANGLALTSTAGLNFAGNRRFTFRVDGGSLPSQASKYLLFYVVGLGFSSLAFSAFLLLWREPPRVIELTAALLSGALATVIRYASMRLWVFPAKPAPAELRATSADAVSNGVAERA